jgi:drug/metabolite transporter (DMT)-like permease
MMIVASAFIALSTFLAKGVAGRFDIDATGLHPLQITAGRFLFGWMLWTVVVLIRRPTFTHIHWSLHIFRSFFGWATVACVFWASARMALADATAISFLTPVVTLVLAVLILKERVGPVRWSAVAIMLVGALILLRPGTSAFQPVALIALGAAVFSGIETTFIKKITALEGRLQILFINNSVGLLIAVTAAWFVWEWPSIEQWGLLAAVGLSMAAAQVFFLTSMRDGDASYVVPFMYSALIFAAALDYVFFADAPDLFGVIGAVVIVAGAIFLALREQVVARRRGG